MSKETKLSETFGLKLFTVGFLIMLFGLLIGFAGMNLLANIIMPIGFFIGAAGMAIHFRMLVRKFKNRRWK